MSLVFVVPTCFLSARAPVPLLEGLSATDHVWRRLARTFTHLQKRLITGNFFLKPTLIQTLLPKMLLVHQNQHVDRFSHLWRSIHGSIILRQVGFHASIGPEEEGVLPNNHCICVNIGRLSDVILGNLGRICRRKHRIAHPLPTGTLEHIPFRAALRFPLDLLVRRQEWPRHAGDVVPPAHAATAAKGFCFDLLNNFRCARAGK
mmetsp:Transcript_44915/g.97733  ORF Transcript_44915/g.97733 Transcript_44915/m.97733 type:complete len:204 (+) Transcript_44915:297-908(+)